MTTPRTVATAVFDPKLRTYWFWTGAFGLLVTVVGWPVLPFWLLGLGQYVGRRKFDALSCELTDRAVMLRRGFLFRVEKTIPLDKIQDLSMHEGPVLRALGLASLKVETAGTSAPQGMADADLTGVIDAPRFRDAVIAQRDELSERSAPAAVEGLPQTAGGAFGDPVLLEIRDSLHRIERLLADRT